MEEAKFKFGIVLEKQLLKALLLNRNFLLIVYELIKPQYFEKKPHAIVFQIIQKHFKKYKDVPTFDALKNEIKNYISISENIETYNEFLKELQQTEITQGDIDYLKDQTVNFCKRQAYKIATLKTIEEYVDKNEFDKIDKMFKDIGLIGLDVSPAYDYFKDPLKRLVEEKKYREYINTGIGELDKIMKGGWEHTQHPVSLIMAPSNAGKSIALVHFGAMAIYQNKKVIHYTFELSEEMISARYDAALTKVKMCDRLHNELTLAEKIKMLGNHVGNNLRIKYYPTGSCTVSMLESNLQQLRDQDFIPDIIIVDYLDIMKNSNSKGNPYQDQKEITEQLRALATTVKKSVISATQTNRGGKAASKNNELIDDDLVGDSYGKIQVADLVISINQKPSDYRIKKAILYITKNRVGHKGAQIAIELDYMTMCLRQWEGQNSDTTVGNENSDSLEMLDNFEGIDVITDNDFRHM